MKKLINGVDDVVADALAGLAAAHPDLKVDLDTQIVVRRESPKPGKVGLVSGGGSGHEPLHGGFVGIGMLDAACPGAIFTSPVPDQVVAATKAVDGGAGILHVVKNYTGDLMNFTLAAELAADEGVVVESVVVSDDVAVEDSTWTAGRRGTGATLFVEKIAGALAERGADLAAVSTLARHVAERSGSFGIALTSCTTPAAGKPTFALGADEIEVGVGIHGEPGRARRPLGTARELAELATTTILGDADLNAGDQVLAMVNGLGATPLIELYVVFGELSRILAGRGIGLVRNLVGNYVTSLDMAGFSLTICHLDDQLIELWDDPVRTPALRWGL